MNLPWDRWVRRVPGLTFALAAGVALGAAVASSPAPPGPASTSVLLVVGAEGEATYATNFVEQVRRWDTTAARAGARLTRVGHPPDSATEDREALQAALAAEVAETNAPLWLVLIGHGTFDGKEARFNLRGPDVTASELAAWLRPLRRPVVVIDTSSSSAPFLNALAGTNRVVVTATRSGHEQNFARFGAGFAEALTDPESDLDHDGQVSLLEAFVAGAHRVAEFYRSEGRLATEHALIDDNGDGRGTPAEWFRGLRAVRKAEPGAVLDGARAHQFHLVLSPSEQAVSPEFRARRDALELEVARLREAKSTLKEEEYYQRLEAVLLELARLTPDAAAGE